MYTSFPFVSRLSRLFLYFIQVFHIRIRTIKIFFDVDVMNAETIITIVVIRIMRDGVRGVYERVVATTLRNSTGNIGIV